LDTVLVVKKILNIFKILNIYIYFKKIMLTCACSSIG
jgi:hypothetical protein